MSSSESENNVEMKKMISSNCGMFPSPLSSNNYNSNYNHGDQVQVDSIQLDHHFDHTFSRHHNHNSFEMREQNNPPSTSTSTTTNSMADQQRTMTTATAAPRHYVETPDIFKELPKMSNTLNHYANSNFTRCQIMVNDESNDLTGNVHLAIDHSIDGVKEGEVVVLSSGGHHPHPPPLPILPSSSSISSSSNSDTTLTCGSSFSPDNNYPMSNRQLPLHHPLSYGQQLQDVHQQNNYGIPPPLPPSSIDGSGHDCHHYPYHDVNYMSNDHSKRMSQLASEDAFSGHCTMKGRGQRIGCHSSSTSTSRNFSRSYSSSSQLSSSDYGSTATGPPCPDLAMYSPLNVYTQNNIIESNDCLGNNYLEAKFSESSRGQVSPVIETILSPCQYQLPPSSIGSHGSHYSIDRRNGSLYGDVIYHQSHELRNQFGDQSTILDSYATIQRLKEPSMIPSSPSLILSPRVVSTSNENETWNQINTATTSDTIQQQYLKHKSNIEKQSAKDSEKIKSKMSHKSSSNCGKSLLDDRKIKKRGRKRRKSSSSSSWIVHLLASCPFVCFLVQGKAGKRTDKVLASLPGQELGSGAELENGRTELTTEMGEDFCSLTILDKSGQSRKPFSREMTGNENEDDEEEEEECFDSSNCNFSSSKVKCLERMKSCEGRYLEVKQTEEDALNNVSFNNFSSSDDQSRNENDDIVKCIVSEKSSMSNCSQTNKSFPRRAMKLFLLLIISILTLLTLNYLIPTFNISGIFSRYHGNDHYNEGSGLDPCERWWKEGIFYEIFPSSFKDSNSDGFGDLNGIRQKLNYLKSDLGVTGIRLNSVFKALDYPFQYDHVVDFKSVDPHIGTLDDFTNLVNDVHDLGMAIILDVNPVMTSDQHPWATQWLLNKSLPSSSGDFSTFYSPNPKNDKPLDVTSSTAIDRENVRDLEEVHISFGGHLYLNWSSPGVQSSMMQVFDFWLNLGVDGFYLKNIHLIQVNSPEDVLEILHNLKILLLPLTSGHDLSHDHGRSSASTYLSSSSEANVRREKRADSSRNNAARILKQKKADEEEKMENFSVEIEMGFDEGLGGGKNISQSNHSSFLLERRNLANKEEEEEDVVYDAGDLNRKSGKKEKEGENEAKRRKVVKRRSFPSFKSFGTEKQRKGHGMLSRILMASKYSLDLLSDQIRKHFELKYFSSLRFPFPKHTLPKSKTEQNEKVGQTESLNEEKNGKGEREGTDKENRRRKGMKREMFDGKQKLKVKEGNVRQEKYIEEGSEEEPDLNSMKDQRKGKETLQRRKETVRSKRESVVSGSKSTGSNRGRSLYDEDVSTHNKKSNILQAIQNKIDDHQGIHLEFYGSKKQHQIHDEKPDVTINEGKEEEEIAQEQFNESSAGSRSYEENDHNLNILDQVLRRGSSMDTSNILSDDSSIHIISSKSNDRNNNNNNVEVTTSKSVYSYFDLVDIYLDIQLNQTENIRDQINSVYINEPPSHPWVNWNIGSSVTSRLATRLGSNVTLTSMFILFMLPGTVTILYGDEIALKNSINPTTNKDQKLIGKAKEEKARRGSR